MGGIFSGQLLYADPENQSHFALLRQDFVLNLIEIFIIFTKFP